MRGYFSESDVYQCSNNIAHHKSQKSIRLYAEDNDVPDSDSLKAADDVFGPVCARAAGAFKGFEIMASDDTFNSWCDGIPVQLLADIPGVLTCDCRRVRTIQYPVMISFAFNSKTGMKGIINLPTLPDSNIIRQKTV